MLFSSLQYNQSDLPILTRSKYGGQIKFIIVMGQSHTRICDIQKINFDEWELTKSYQHYDLMRHSIHDYEAELRYLTIDSNTDQDKQLELYQLRKSTLSPLIKVLGIQKITSQSPQVCGTDLNIKVLTERIEYQFRELPKLPCLQYLYCLSQALEGYRVLYEKLGLFDVNYNMMGVNREGIFKVWSNQNYGKNRPDQQLLIFNSIEGEIVVDPIKNEKQMVRNILQIFLNRQQGWIPQSLSKGLWKASSCFLRCQNYLDNYVFENKLILPPKLTPKISESPKKALKTYSKNKTRKKLAVFSHIISQNQDLHKKSMLLNSPNQSYQYQTHQFHPKKPINPQYHDY